MSWWRMGLGALGALGLGVGLCALTTTVPGDTLLLVTAWLVAAVIIHDALWSPTLLGLGWLLSQLPAPARRYLQGGLVVAGSLTLVAVPMIYVRGRQPPSKAILPQDVGVNLALLLGLVAAAAMVGYVVQALRDHSRRHE